MVIYTIIMIATAIVFGVVAVQIYKGKTELIHDYHRTKVTDKSAYGKAFGKAIGVMSTSMALSGVVAMLGESAMWGAIAVLLIGITAGIIAITRVQKKYNGGVL